MNKRSVIVLLVGLNLALLAALLFSGHAASTAYAQAPRGGGGGYAAISTKTNEDFDALFIVDQGNRRLHCFTPTRTGRSLGLSYVNSRDLESDFAFTD